MLLTDGTSKDIEDLRVGDTVSAQDVESGDTQSRAVTDVRSHAGTKKLVTLAVDTDGAAGDGTATVTSTAAHPYWLPDVGRWVIADQLKPGMWLQTGAGTWVQVTAIEKQTRHQRVHNLTVNGLDTYFILAGDTTLLTHNCGDTPPGVQCVCRPGTGAGPSDPPIRVQGPWTREDIVRGSLGLRPSSLGNRLELHHADQMPGSAIHELDQLVHRGPGTDLHRNIHNQGVTPQMRMEDTQLHWWYRSQEQGWGVFGPEQWFDNWPG